LTQIHHLILFVSSTAWPPVVWCARQIAQMRLEKWKISQEVENVVGPDGKYRRAWGLTAYLFLP